MRRPIEHHAQGIFVAEGEKVVRRLLESDFGVVSVLLPEKWLKDYEPLLHARPEPDIPVFVTELRALEQLVGFPMFQGVLAVGKIPNRPILDQILSKKPHPSLLVAIDGLTSAENVGVIVRNCAAFHADGLIVGETSSSPFLRRAVRNSMGAIFHLPIFETPGLVQTLRDLRSRGIRVVAAHPHVEGKTLPQSSFTQDCCIVLGSEGDGISAPVLAMCDEAVAIPMPDKIDSLNVNAAAAVFLYEINRQRQRYGNPS